MGRRTEDSDIPAESALGKYVYCVIQSADPLKFGVGGIGDNGSEIHTVHSRDLAAVVSNVPLGVLDSTRENVLAHERVNEIVMRDHTVIPMSFGTVFKTGDDIVQLLRSAYEAWEETLRVVVGRGVDATPPRVTLARARAVDGGLLLQVSQRWILECGPGDRPTRPGRHRRAGSGTASPPAACPVA